MFLKISQVKFSENPFHSIFVQISSLGLVNDLGVLDSYRVAQFMEV